MSGRTVAAMAASLLLRYPDEEALAALPAIRSALLELPSTMAEPLALVVTHRSCGDPMALAAEYVELFDLRRRCCLYLSYYTAGDTRARGEALVAFAAAYREAGFAIAGGELPDHLPTVLELAAHAGEPGWALLRRHRVGLDLLAAALTGSVYRHAVEAVRSMLPPPGPADLVAAATLARSGPPREEVGLQPFTLGGRR
jgi:nitrate reductase molybdenum cofactor assembly chaperone NarJ/NarW